MIGDLVYELVQIPGPTGYESRVANRLKELLEKHVDEIYIGKIGNLIARKKGAEGKRSPALVARRYSHSPDEVADLSNAERAADVLGQAITDLDQWDE
ncbi:MAG: hypothetical protein CL874_00635 [Dehalococcoidales bacterium]|jgi:hypothetical protein|nr:hypothetical protein [Dehalococcoidales bacterium]MDP6449121.1 hypothetical protein [Dehalococcoidales bacterium]MDP6576206.1 hypothetical protein [Dehalococcoidales bacterium]MDP6825263.1 hypothetical protein [Dehalococcoidales bacterium]|tara:strand:+ start:333 stop:626 length:294 start_codon:yes stop_codon:yes gene_type:complete